RCCPGAEGPPSAAETTYPLLPSRITDFAPRTPHPAPRIPHVPADEADKTLVARIRSGDEAAWQECIDRFEGRLMAFAISRLSNRSSAEDVVQETCVGFLTSLPNYDENSPIESFLFAIAAHKLTDLLRREGRRPT